MKKKMIKSDMVIVGGSIAGISAAIRAKECEPDVSVTVVEKYFSGYAGKANRGGGIMIAQDGKAKPEDFVKYHTEEIGEYLNNQEILLDYASKFDRNIQWMDRWSEGKLDRQADGSVSYGEWAGPVIGTWEDGMPKTGPSELPWRMAAFELDFLLPMKKTALKLGVKFIDRVGIVDLLTNDDKIAGCVGYHIEDGDTYVFEAKAVILCTGSQNYRILPMWSCGRGEGIAAAWRAGARMANPEYGSFCNWINKGSMEAMFGCELGMYNNKGENIGLRTKTRLYNDITAQSIAEWYKEMRAGNGPMIANPADNTLMLSVAPMLGGNKIYDRPFADKFWGKLFFNAGTNQTDEEYVPGLIGELSPVWTDKTFAASIPGLFCAGDICYTGTGAVGAVPAPPSRTRGGGLAFALYSGIESAETAASYAKDAEYGCVDEAQVTKSHAEMFAPMGKVYGIHPNDLVRDIQAVVGEIGNSVCKSKERLESAINSINEIEKRFDRVKASDMHELFLANEARSMIFCAKLFFTTSLMREESRGWFVREDFPERNDEEWLKWTMVDNVDGEMKISYEPVPIETYPNQIKK